MKTLYYSLAAVLLALSTGAAVRAQTASQAVSPYVDSACGAWQGDTWVPNGDCPKDVKRHERVAGTIVSVKGHLVTLQQSQGTVVIDDRAALENQQTGKVAVGREVVAHGYWDQGTFYATLIATQEIPPP